MRETTPRVTDIWVPPVGNPTHVTFSSSLGRPADSVRQMELLLLLLLPFGLLVGFNSLLEATGVAAASGGASGAAASAAANSSPASFSTTAAGGADRAVLPLDSSWPMLHPLQKSSQSPSAIFNSARSKGRLSHSTSQLTTCGPNEARARTVLALRITWALVTIRMESVFASSSSRQRMRNPVPELSLCCLLLQGSLYERETLVTSNFTTGRVLLDDDFKRLPPDDELSPFARFRAAYAFSISMETPPPDEALSPVSDKPSSPPPTISPGTPPPSIPSTGGSWLLSSSDIFVSPLYVALRFVLGGESGEGVGWSYDLRLRWR
mmetsp:Transcript_7137/g.17745  ORF Transcript_7137/g.17745 Transcript_7137/m.17745 type:complete len:322 (-) Transcript_7137:71-1036(-)